ncbi:penicillin acylase [Stenotrophomonas chelatiphaga]|uniref:Penicillin acylase n=1 Tax=Stenotrophomonas chelatiphaga TaxID=517011 RepID=A0A0R0D031_9GAMM|nr:penicillin acylase family protein [Stenotrophomonas chelatiphaga]KRG74757.1 penicillin acylase [Stenotrophomonas chelatiphaga]
MRRWLMRLFWLLLVLALGLGLAGWWLLRGSLAPLDGEQVLGGLQAPVTVSRDRLGVVTIEGASERDVMRALGQVHAQERGFEMDLMRRSAAGELSVLFGPAALEADKRMRVHRLRHRASREPVSAELQAYVEGVNEGIARLRVRPWPYLLLRQQPAPWQASDSLLTGYAMYADLQDPGNQSELAYSRLRAVVPPALYALLSHDGSSWDAPLMGGPRGDARLPAADVLDLRGQPAAPAAAVADTDVKGSNNFAVGAALTADGRAILADDMHLGLRAPNIWFRVRLRYPDPQAPGGKVDVSGFSLPGLPAIIVGSNGYVAWGFTNSYIDTADFRPVPAGTKLAEYHEKIEVAGAPPVDFIVRESAWGPLLHQRADGSGDALRWVAHQPGAVSLALTGLARVADIDQALQVADHTRIPAQNLLLADRNGRIGWRVLGARPDRAAGCAPTDMRTTAADGCPAWGIRSDAAPSLVDPPSHRLWTANGRVMDGEALAVAGDGGYDLGARGAQIRDALQASERFSEAGLLAIQLDDRALFLQRWWQLLRQVVVGSNDPQLQRLEVVTRTWDGHASVDSVSYRVVRGFRGMLLDEVSGAMLAPARQTLGDDWLEPRLAQFESVLWPLVTQRPAHLLPPGHASWDALLADTAKRLEADLGAQGPLAERSWGERNTAAICHPISRALPAIARRWLCMPAEPLPGDNNMPRVQGPGFGASQRMVVSPGHEDQGIIHMPGGQSGHPLSPFWAAGHEDHVHGRPTPFLPGPSQHTLTLRPAR